VRNSIFTSKRSAKLVPGRATSDGKKEIRDKS